MAEINKLSDKKLKTFLGVPRDKEVSLADGKGLSIRVSKNGHVSWVYTYRLGGEAARWSVYHLALILMYHSSQLEISETSAEPGLLKAAIQNQS